MIGEALAWEYAASRSAAAILQEHMLWRVPIETKLNLLGEVMKAHDLADVFPSSSRSSPGCSRYETSLPTPWRGQSA
jgi:hypothetical protein